MTSQRREVVVGDADVLREHLRTVLAQAAARAAGEGRRWSMAIPGGSVVTRLLAGLRPADAPWASCDLCWVDERAVPWTDPDSNYGAARATWLDALALTGVRLHPIPVDAPSLEASATVYEETLSSVLGEGGVLDVAIVGVGEDGHVASLFPGDEVALASTRRVVPVSHAPKPPARRLTLTLRTLAGARVVVVAAFGGTKRSSMRAALLGEDWELPIARLVREAGCVHVLLDHAAAARG